MRILVAALISFASVVHAGQVFKCVDSSGKVTFTQSNCPEKHDFDSVVEAKNVAPSGSGPAVKMATQKMPVARTSVQARDGQAFTVVGEQTGTPERLKEKPERSTEPVYRSVPNQPRIVIEERTISRSVRDKNGNRLVGVEVVKVPVVK